MSTAFHRMSTVLAAAAIVAAATVGIATQAAAAPGGTPSSRGTSGYPYDPGQDRNGDGVVSGHERCGTACGDAPTSGETQMRYLCEKGTVTGPECDAY